VEAVGGVRVEAITTKRDAAIVRSAACVPLRKLVEAPGIEPGSENV